MRLLIVLLLVIGSFLSAQEVIRDKDGYVTIITHCRVKYVRDTLSYLKEFESSKNKYIGKPFSVLLNDMTMIQPKTVWSFSMGRVKTASADTRFSFANIEQSFNNSITLLIKWVDPIPRNETKYYEQKNNFYFTNDERSFYGSKIIKDIIVYR